MGLGVWELLLIFLIVMVLFGTQRLRSMGGDLGASIRGFKAAMRDGEDALSASAPGDKQGR